MSGGTLASDVEMRTKYEKDMQNTTLLNDNDDDDGNNNAACECCDHECDRERRQSTAENGSSTDGNSTTPTAVPPPDLESHAYDTRLGAWICPFPMAKLNTRVRRRSGEETNERERGGARQRKRERRITVNTLITLDILITLLRRL